MLVISRATRPVRRGDGREPRRPTVLAAGAHPDDIELGCGATLAAHADAGDRVVMLVMTDGERGPGATREQRRAEQRRAAAVIGAELRWGSFADGRVPDGFEAVGAVESVVAEIAPDIVYTHAPDDSHQDHRAVSRAVESAARRVPRLLFYESPTALAFTPTVFVDVTATAHRKLAALRAHASQVAASDRVDLPAVEALLRVRGDQSRSGCAEAFSARRLTLPASHMTAVRRTIRTEARLHGRAEFRTEAERLPAAGSLCPGDQEQETWRKSS